MSGISLSLKSTRHRMTLNPLAKSLEIIPEASASPLFPLNFSHECKTFEVSPELRAWLKTGLGSFNFSIFGESAPVFIALNSLKKSGEELEYLVIDAFLAEADELEVDKDFELNLEEYLEFFITQLAETLKEERKLEEIKISPPKIFMWDFKKISIEKLKETFVSIGKTQTSSWLDQVGIISSASAGELDPTDRREDLRVTRHFSDAVKRKAKEATAELYGTPVSNPVFDGGSETREFHQATLNWFQDEEDSWSSLAQQGSPAVLGMLLMAFLILCIERAKSADSSGTSGRKTVASLNGITVTQLGQTHGTTEGLHSDMKSGVLLKILRSQLKVGEAIKANPGYPVFSEGLITPMLATDLAHNGMCLIARKLFPKGLPPASKVDSLNQLQAQFLHYHGGEKVQFFLGIMRAVFPATDLETQVELNRRMTEGPIDASFFEFISTHRERKALEQIIKYLPADYRGKVHLVYGASHDFSRVSEEMGFGYQFQNTSGDANFYNLHALTPEEREMIQKDFESLRKDIDFSQFLDTHGAGEFDPGARERLGELSERLREVAENSKYVEETMEAFHEISENFDLSSSDHVKRAKAFLRLKELSGLSPSYEIYIHGGDSDAPHLQQVRFELVSTPAGENFQYSVSQDLFGQTLPETFKFVEEKFPLTDGKKITVEYTQIQTKNGCLLIYLDHIGLVGAAVGERTASVGGMFSFFERLRQLAKELGTKKLFVQFDPQNKRLGELLLQRYQSHGVMPLIAKGPAPKKVSRRYLELFDEEHQMGIEHCVIELEVHPKEPFIEPADAVIELDSVDFSPQPKPKSKLSKLLGVAAVLGHFVGAEAGEVLSFDSSLPPGETEISRLESRGNFREGKPPPASALRSTSEATSLVSPEPSAVIGPEPLKLPGREKGRGRRIPISSSASQRRREPEAAAAPTAANSNHMDAKEILDFADEVFSEVLLNEYRGEASYKTLIQKERERFDAARENARLNPGQSGALLHLQEIAQRMHQMFEMHREIAVTHGESLEHYADEMMEAKAAQPEKSSEAVNHASANGEVRSASAPEKVSVSAAPSPEAPAKANFPVPIPTPAPSSRVPAPTSGADYSSFSAEQKVNLLNLQRAQAALLMSRAEAIHDHLLTERKLLSGERAGLKTELEGLMRHFAEFHKTNGLEVTRWTDQRYLNNRVWKGTPFMPEVGINFTPPNVGAPANTSQAIGDIWHGLKASLRAFGPGVLGGLAGEQVQSFLRKVGFGEVTADMGQISAAGVVTGLAGLACRLNPYAAASYAGFVVSAHTAEVLAKYESRFLNPDLSPDAGRNAAVKAVIGCGQVFNDFFGVIFGGLMEGVKGFAMDFLKKPDGNFHLIPTPVIALLEGLYRGTKEPLDHMIDHTVKILEGVWSVGANPWSKPDGLRQFKEALARSPIFSDTGTGTAGGFVEGLRQAAAAKVPEISVVRDFYDVPAAAPEPASVIPEPPASPPKPIIFRPAPPPISNFSDHLWANKFYQERYSTPTDYWRQQNQFKYEASKSSVSYLSNANLYGSLNERSSLSNPFTASWFGGGSLGTGSRYSGTFNQWGMESAARRAMDEVRFHRGTFEDAYLRMSRDLGWPSGFDFRAFVNVLRSAGLVSSYEAMHVRPYSNIPRSGSLLREIGGVATRVGKIEGLKALLEEGKIKNFNFMIELPDGAQPFTPDALLQVLHELREGVFVHEAYPFFSLHPNALASQHPVVHPCYENTLVGYIIAILDYWMKGFLNGGTFPEDFLVSWPESQNLDEGFLRAFVIDLKKYCRVQGIEYTSLREMNFKLGLEFPEDSTAFSALSSDPNSIFKMKFQTSFRIIAKQNGFEFDPESNTFRIQPDFDVEYSIDLMPDYEAYLERYKKEHGSYPLDYQAVLALYETMAKQIHDTLPRLPFCREYFNQLGVISFCSYLFNTMRSAGFVPVLPTLDHPREISVPKVFPFFPLRYFKKFEFQSEVRDVLDLSPSEQMMMGQYLRSALDNPALTFPANISASLEGVFRRKLEAKTREAGVFEHLSEEDPEFLTKVPKTLRDQFHKTTKNLAEQFRKLFVEELKTLNQQAELNLPVTDLTSKPLEESLRGLESAARKQHSDGASDSGPILREIYRQMDQAFERELQDAYRKLDARVSAELASHGVSMNPELAEAIRQDKKQIKDESMPNLVRLKAEKKVKVLQVLTQNRDQILGAVSALRAEINRPFELLREHAELHSNGSNVRLAYSCLEMPKSECVEHGGSYTKLVGGCGLSMRNQVLKQVSLPMASLGMIPGRELCLDRGNARFGFALESRRALSPLDYADFVNPKHREKWVHPLDKAVMAGDLSTLNSHLDAHPEDLEKQNRYGQTPLILAAQYGQSEAVRALLSRGANPNHLPMNENFALYLAIQEGWEETALALIESETRAINLNLVNSGNGMTALHLAIEMGEEKIALALISAGADLKIQRLADGAMPLHLAAKLGCTEICTELLLKDSDQLDRPLPSGDTPLHLAVQGGYLKTARELREWGAKTQILNAAGETPGLLAASLGYREIAEDLATFSPSLVSFDLSAPKSTQEVRPSRIRLDDIEYVRKYIQSWKSKGPAKFEREIKTIILWAGFYGSKICLKEALKHLRPNELAYKFLEKDGGGGGVYGILHPLFGAVMGGKKSCIEIILEHSPKSLNEYLQYVLIGKGLDGKEKIRDLKAVHVAAEYGHYHLFEYFQKRGADLTELRKGAEGQQGFYGTNSVNHILLQHHDEAGLREFFRLVPLKMAGWTFIEDVCVAAVHGNLSGWNVLKEKEAELRKIAAQNPWIVSRAVPALFYSGQLDKLEWLLSVGAKLVPKEIERIQPFPSGKDPKLPEITDRPKEDDKRQTPIMHAVMAGNLPLVKQQCPEGYDPRMGDIEGNTALHLALIHEKYEVAKYLIPICSSRILKLKNREGLSPFMLAIIQKQRDLVQILSSPDEIHRRDKQGRNALHLAAIVGFTEVMPLLLELGADLDFAVEKTGSTALHLSAQAKQWKAFLFLLQAGADPLIKNLSGKTALELGIQANLPELSRLIAKLPQSAELKMQKKLWFAAALGGNLTIFRELLLNGFPVNAAKKNGMNALHFAVLGGKKKALHFLLCAGIVRDAAEQHSGMTALMLSAKFGQGVMLKLLIEFGADLNLQNGEKQSALHLAVEKGSKWAVSLLLQAGINRELQDDFAYTAEEIAHKKYPEIEEVFHG